MPVDGLESMRRAGAVTAALARAPGGKVTMLDPRPLVKVRVLYGRAIAFTPTHVLHEWVRYGEYHCKWDARAQVRRVGIGDWNGEQID